MEFAINKQLGDDLIKYILAYILGPLTGSVFAAIYAIFSELKVYAIKEQRMKEIELSKVEFMNYSSDSLVPKG